MKPPDSYTRPTEDLSEWWGYRDRVLSDIQDLRNEIGALRASLERHEETRKLLVAQCAAEYERVVALRASLARKDEALRACGEALEK